MPNPVVHFEIGCRDSAASPFRYGAFAWFDDPDRNVVGV
jgi:hypothetical protein